MKLWKIMLAALVCVLMLSAVAMADTHVCTEANMQYITGSDRVVSYMMATVGGQGAHTPVIEYRVKCNVCGTEQIRQKIGDQVYCTVTTWSTVSNATCTEQKVEGGSCAVCGAYYTRKVGTELGHDWNRCQTFPATCQKGAYHVEECMTCGKTKEVVESDRVSCKFVDKQISAATCQAKAKWASVCVWCGEILFNSTSEVGEKAAHDYAWTTEIPATCTTKGVKTGVCKVCGDKGGYAEIAATGHKADYSTEKTVNATCTAAGKKTAECYVCGQTFKTADIAALGHAKTTIAYKDAACGYDGNFTYEKCTRCGMMWDVYGQVITAVPVIPANGKHILHYDASQVIRDCTATNNYVDGKCEVCGQYARVYVPAKEHNFPAAKNSNLVSGTKATCTNAGSGYVKCTGCSEQKWVSVPALGHEFKTWNYSAAATCVTDLTATSKCTRCDVTTTKVVEEALGHNWIVETGTDATCTAAGKATRMCTRCLTKQHNVSIPAKGHDFSKVVKVVAPTCEAQGYTVYGCSRCDATQNGASTAAAGHSYSWVVVTKPSAAGNGKNEYKCSVCGNVAKTETVKYSNWYYNNTFTSFGPSTRELVGGNDWYRVTPVDLTVDGVYTYDLIASNKYVVGKVTIAVNAGALTVSYKTNNNVEINAESLLIYANKADLAAGVAVSAPVGAAIDAAANFPGDSKVLVSLVLTGNYDAAGKSTMDASAAAGMVANID